jgi:soluble calcium-activated nucleotidase 1
MLIPQGKSFQRGSRSVSAGSLDSDSGGYGRGAVRPSERRVSRSRWSEMVGSAHDRHQSGYRGSSNSLPTASSRQSSVDLETGRSLLDDADENDKERRGLWSLGLGFAASSAASSLPSGSATSLSGTNGTPPSTSTVEWLRQRSLRGLLYWLLALCCIGLLLDYSVDHLLHHSSFLGNHGHDYRNRDMYRPDRPWGPFVFGVITDMDRLSAVPHRSKASKSEWIAYFRRGELEYRVHDARGNRSAEGVWTIRWHEPAPGVRLTTQLSEAGRGMELSELVYWRGRYLTPCDRTGIVYEILNARLPKPYVASRYVLATGDGEHAKGFKAEWMTVQHGALFIGGHGRETTDAHNGTHVVNYDALWVKRIAPDGVAFVEHLNWTNRYERLRRAAGTAFPGYLEHEAVVWSERRSQWLFLPRRFSVEPYDERANEFRGWNGYLLADENFQSIQLKHLNVRVDGERGFSSVKFLPFTGDRLAIALRTIEHEDEGVYRTYLTVFQVDDGRVLLADTPVGEHKYEGIEFL